MVGNLTKKNKKCQMPGGQPGGVWAPLDLTHTFILQRPRVQNTVIDPFRQRSNRGIILNAVFNNSAHEAIDTFYTQNG